ncbi:DoxX family protein [Actinomycetospora sp. CA-101289]|uniref:DoxX family protein n=1 Tax=Actinomycetospora sp. CA-101289 TaxID=3239893 RepID=UPI003D9546F9
MVIAYIGVTVAAIVANALAAGADLTRAQFVLDNSASVGVPLSWLTPLGLLKGAGAAGLLLGLLGVPALGTAAAAGLVLFFVGAVVTHLRAGDRSAALAFPASFLLLAVAALAAGVLVG